MNVLPKSAWFNSFPSARTDEQNHELVLALNEIYKKYGLLSDTINLDFTAIPYFGEESSLENNWNGKYGRSLRSFQALLVQDSKTKYITYADATIRRENQDYLILEVLEIYQRIDHHIGYFVFDSKFTT
ncbi:MAG: hypothetical protein LBF12_04900 [Christensenellaceae bacterium]|jgi:predicted ATPase|nr:hypothetical protein [Christensenellaceae bacterium]